MFKWVKNVKLYGFIETYHAPFKPKYRYWTGLLLLLQILLNIFITANVSGNPQQNLLTTGIIITLLIVLKTYIGNNLYKSKTLDYVENICYFNLLFLTIATFYTRQINKQEILTNASITVTLILFLCILVYHVHYALSNCKWYRKLSDWIMTKVKRRTPRSAVNDTTSIKLNNRLFKCFSTEVTFSNSVLTIDDQFQETCSTTSFNEQDQQTKTKKCTRTGNTLREPLLVQDV